MIQRIQSIYLFIAVVLSVIFAVMDFFSFQINTNEIATMNVFAMKSVNETISNIPIAVLSLISILLTFASIFLYKNRLLQIRLNVINIVILLGIYVLIAVYIFFNVSDEAKLYPHFSLIIPFINIILTLLAIKGIKSDEALVRSLDHLR